MLLSIQSVEKPWGVLDLPSPFQSAHTNPIGEIWFDPPPALPDILIKYIFTSDKLSVQVHPSDADTDKVGLGHQGKEECWLITSAEPGASLAIGFKEKFGAADVRAAALNGSIEDLLVWHPVSDGDFFYIPAGTVHAIGADVSLIEVQQTSDITYRLYDYGRPRELHLDEALAVARLAPYDAKFRKRLAPTGSQLLVDGPHFELHYVDGSAGNDVFSAAGQPALILPLEGSVSVGGEGVIPGQCALVDGEEIRFGEGDRFLLARSLSDANSR
ncbi:mannose-6-phosphate isomerase [Sphingorhabdus pulchriflava]|uniref:Mannose-6-phosphate isomerase n=1 Tax=Sphingorhabdus pulchriflava TaxID=2292257 RepID=A0A371B212_9SPHN|nr:class I mannose-6-phosphate isomerase [Sphingorhabdus pulchriflava]RDV01483.1 mannose-6-phosphate isomerase [Sphingorhabdus pulchriflava]